MKTKIKLEIERKNGDTFFVFEIDEDLENIFKQKAEEIKTSRSWLQGNKGLSFYSIPGMTTNEDYKILLRKYGLIDDYGTSLYSPSMRYFNIAFIRTVGGRGKILVNEDIPFATVSQGIRNIVAFLKEYYSEYLREYKVKGKVDFEV
jgi:hypothetical protein